MRYNTLRPQARMGSPLLIYPLKNRKTDSKVGSLPPRQEYGNLKKGLVNMAPSTHQTPPQTFRFSGFQILVLVGLIILVTILLTAWWMNKNIYAAPYTPTALTNSERQTLNSKMARLTEGRYQSDNSGKAVFAHSATAPLEPESYREDDSKREIHLSEKELNALIANDSETAKHMAIDLAKDLVSVKLLVPMAQDFPVLGGKTLQVHVGVVLKYINDKPVVAIRGISLGGIPIPQSWWGDIKNMNLIEQFGHEGEFWDQFAKGVENIDIQEGQLRVKLKE